MTSGNPSSTIAPNSEAVSLLSTSAIKRLLVNLHPDKRNSISKDIDEYVKLLTAEITKRRTLTVPRTLALSREQAKQQRSGKTTRWPFMHRSVVFAAAAHARTTRSRLARMRQYSHGPYVRELIRDLERELFQQDHCLQVQLSSRSIAHYASLDRNRENAIVPYASHGTVSLSTNRIALDGYFQSRVDIGDPIKPGSAVIYHGNEYVVRRIDQNIVRFKDSSIQAHISGIHNADVNKWPIHSARRIHRQYLLWTILPDADKNVDRVCGCHYSRYVTAADARYFRRLDYAVQKFRSFIFNKFTVDSNGLAHTLPCQCSPS